MLTNLSGIQFRLKVVVNAALALVATYWFANGMLLWLLAVPIRWPAEREEVRPRFKAVTGWYAVYGIAVAISIGLYFFDYTRPRQHPEFVDSLPGRFR